MSFEDFKHAAVVVVVVTYVLFGTLGLRYPAARAESEVLDWARRWSLPRDDERFAEAVRLRLRRARWSSVGGLLGMIAGAPALLVDFGFAGLGGVMAGAITGQGIGEWCGSARYRRAPSRPRRLRDYLSRTELGLEAGGLAFGICALVVAVVLGRPDRILITVLAVVGLAGVAAAVLAQWLLLRLELRSRSPFALAWEDAQRAQSLRDVTQFAYRILLPVLIASQAPTSPVETRTDPVWAMSLLTFAPVVLIGLTIIPLHRSARPARL